MRTERPKNRIGATKPISFSLTKALYSLMGAKSGSKGASSGYYALGAAETVVLGRLINSWRSIVGAQLAKKTYPSRYVRKKLFLTVSDSQWMQTLQFYKAEILKKISEAFNDIRVADIVTRVGEIPKEAIKLLSEPKPLSWQAEKGIEITPAIGSRLKNVISRCAKKSAAKLKALQQKGFALCSVCKSNITASKNGICAVCAYNARIKSRQNARAILYDMPWLSFEDLTEIDFSLSAVEADSIRQELLNETLSYIDELSFRYSLEVCNANEMPQYEQSAKHKLVREMKRAVMLNCACRPEDIDFSKITFEQMPFDSFNAALKLVFGGGVC